MAMTAQEYLDTFNAAINSGAYDSAANILRAAEGDFGPGIYDVAGVVLEANPNLPQEIDYMSPQGIQNIRDYVASVPAPVASYGPPSPAVSPAVSNSTSLTPAGIAALAPSANVPSPANVFSPADYGPPSPPPAAPPTASPAEIQRMQAQRAEAELLRLREAERPIVDPRPQPVVDPVAQKYVNDFNALIDQGNYDGAARLVKEAELAGYGDEAYRAAAVALDANTNLPPELNFLNAEGIASIKSFVEEATRPPPPPPAATVAKSFDEQLNELANQNFGRSLKPSEMDTYRTEYGGELNDANISDFLKRSQTEIDQVKTARDAATKAIDTAAANAEGRPGPDQIFGIPRFERQTQSNVPFAPLRRGLAQLRPAMYMPGLTSGQAPLGGSGFTPESLRGAIQSMTAAGQTPADVAYQMDIGGVSPAELSAAIGTPVGQIQGAYNQSRPDGLFSTGAPAPRGLPEDFALQTGAYGAATPTFLNRNSTAAGNTAAGPAGVDQPTYAQLLDNVQRLSAQVQPLLGTNQVDYGGGEVGFSQDPSGLGFFGDVESAFGEPSEESSQAADGNKTGGLIKMAEGGGPPKMAELSAKEAGSTFDISKYIDDEGRLVGGMSKPIRDAYGKIIGYESGDLPLPIQRDVVFGKELRDKEAAMRLTDAEREQMMVEMAMRQGRTGIDPRVGGLAGIEIGDPMMRRRPQYYSTVEQFRPRYAEGGIASVAQNLADKGRKGDSMLVHMTPDEVAGLQALAQQMGGSLTINPQTGLPEANIFKKLLPMALGFALGPAGAGIFSSALTTGLAVGAGYTLATGSLQQGLAAGLGAYGGSNLGTGLQAAGTADAATSAAASDAASSGLQVAGGAGGDAASAAMVESQLGYGDIPFESFNQAPASYSLAAPPPSPTSISLTGGAGSGLSLTPEATGFTATGPSIPGSEQLFTQAPKTSSVLTSDVTGLGSTPTPGSALTGAERYFGDKATSDLAAQRYADATGSTLGTSAMQTLGGATLQSAAEEQEAVKAQQAAIDEKREKRKRLFEEIAERTLGRVNVRSGGLMKLAGGGMSYMEAGGTTGPTGAPRDVVGNGDGMSDSVPADIEGVQEARLADGEFVIPADVVADIGNGSSDAGSKKLYDMMDRVRKARHGTTEQPPEIKAERLMPA
jgi:hypothetical protein